MTGISDFFSKAYSVEAHVVDTPPISLQDGAFPAFLEIDISQSSFECPTALIGYVLKAIRLGYDKLIFNLVSGADSLGRRTFHHKTINNILKTFASANNTMRIAHVVTSKGIHYYGCQGMIFDSHYRLLLLNTVMITPNGDETVAAMTQPKCRLSYGVFANSSEIVEKTIIKQAIPLYGNNVAPLWYANNYYGEASVEVLISNLNNMVLTPRVPSVQYTQTNFNRVIEQEL